MGTSMADGRPAPVTPTSGWLVEIDAPVDARDVRVPFRALLETGRAYDGRRLREASLSMLRTGVHRALLVSAREEAAATDRLDLRLVRIDGGCLAVALAPTAIYGFAPPSRTAPTTFSVPAADAGRLAAFLAFNA